MDKAREELQNCYKTKDSLREEYYKNLYEFELQNDKVRHIKQMISQKKRMVEERENMKERIEKKKSELDSRMNPNTKEIETCEHLIQYCNRLKVQQGLVPPSNEEVARKTQYDMISEFNRQDIEQKLKDGKIQAVESKKDDTVQVGGGKGKKGKKNKKEVKQEQAETFNIDFGVIAKFGLVSVSPPSSPLEIEPKIEELKKKKEWFQREGEDTLKKERQDIDKHIEKMVEAEIEEERRKEQIELYGEEEDKEEEDQEERKHSHRGRGGFKGFGDKKYKDRGEFDGSDDEDEVSFQNAYTKPSRGGGQQINRGKVASRGRGAKVPQINDDDDFPTL